MKRRSFLKLSASASALTLLPNEIFALFKAAGMATCPNVNGKKIVLIQLSGANDGLNTVVPLNQYDLYASLRPNIKLANSGINSIINLDSTLPIANQVGLHPAMTGFKNLYDSGKMRMIQGVGYPNQDKSHFKSTDLWLTGGDGTQANSSLDSGWMGRFMESYYANFLTANFPLGIQLGSSENSLGFHGAVEHGMSMNINGQDPAGFYSVVNGLGGQPPANIPNSDYGDLLRFILENDAATNIYAQSISTAFNAGSNSVSYANTGIANQLKSVARFISGGLQTKVYLVKIGGFDTHDLQVATNTTTHLGTHAKLLGDLSAAVNNFISDLTNQNKIDDVVAVTFSEFGRKIAENGNLGTDHGEVAPMFVFGSAIEAGVSGTNINLSLATAANNFQVPTVQHDYRRVFATILQDWLGASSPTLNASLFNYATNTGFVANKVSNLITATATIPTSCHTNTLLSTEVFEPKDEIVAYPNPSSSIVTVHTTNIIEHVSVYSIDGKLVGQYKNDNFNNEFTIEVQQFPIGVYTLDVKTDNGQFSKKIIVKR